MYYKLLGLKPGTSCEDTLRSAYRKEALRWHPGKHPDNKKKAEDMFKKVSEAYSVLLFLSRKHGQTPEPKEKRRRKAKGNILDADSDDPPRSFNLRDAFKLFNDFFGTEDPFTAMEQDLNSPFFSETVASASTAARSPAEQRPSDEARSDAAHGSSRHVLKRPGSIFKRPARA